MMPSFVVDFSLPRVLFGAGRQAALGEEVDRLGARAALLLGTPRQRPTLDALARSLGSRVAAVHDGAQMHVPVTVADTATRIAQSSQADCLVAYGGGSSIGLAKAIALQTSLPIIALPTTYSGSEMTPVYGLTADGVKRTGRDARVMPCTVIYDPDLLSGLPPAVAIPSGLNAMAHAAEGLYAHDGNPLTQWMATEGLRALSRALPSLAESGLVESGLSEPGPLLSGDSARLDAGQARAEALYGAWLCGAVLAQVSMGLHHKLCHTLGGGFGLPHAELHSVMLPYALAYNSAAAPHAMRSLAQALNLAAAANAPAALRAFAVSLGAPKSLSELGMPADGLDRAADLAAQTPYPNPRPLQRDALRELLQRAFEGASPA